MFIRKKQLQEILRRLDALEMGNQKITTVEHGDRALTYYIRLFSGKIKDGRDKNLGRPE